MTRPPKELETRKDGHTVGRFATAPLGRLVATAQNGLEVLR